MSSSDDKNPKKSKRSFIPKLPSFRRKKNNPSPDHHVTSSSKSSSKSKKNKNENSSNKSSSFIAKETQTPKDAPPIYKDKSTSQVLDTYNRLVGLTEEEEEKNGNEQLKGKTALSNINTTSVFSTTTTCFVNPEYEGNIWCLQNQNSTQDAGNHGNNDHEINANITEKIPASPTHIIPLSPVKTNTFQPNARCSSVTSTLSSGSSLSLSSPGSLTKLIGGPKPYKSVFSDDMRGVKRQGSTPSDLDVNSSCVSVSGSVSSLSPTIDDVATKVKVKSGSVPGLNKYPLIAPVQSLSPGVSPNHKREGAYTYDSSGGESEDNSKEKTLTRGSYDLSSAAQKSVEAPNCLVNLNFDLQAAAAASPQINANIRRERQKVLAGKAKIDAVEEHNQKPVTVQQESPRIAEAKLGEEALISRRSAAPARCTSNGPTNNNQQSESKHEALIQATDAHVDSCSALAHRQQQLKSSVRTPRAAPITPQHSTPCSQPSNASTPGEDQATNDEVVLTRVRSVTSPVPLKTSRALYALSHLQLSAMRNKLRSESFDSSDLDSLASDDLMCEADNTFLDPSDESNLTQGNNTMPGEQGFSPYPNTGKGKRLRNNSIEFLVASFDKRHRHHSTGQNYGPYTNGSPRGNLRSSQGAGRDTIVVEASTYRQMVQDLSSMKTALGKLSKMLQDPKTLQEMLAVCQPERDTLTVDDMTQCEQIPMQDGEAQTDTVGLQGATKQAVITCEAASQSDYVARADRGIQSDVTFTLSDGHSTDSSDGQDVLVRGVLTKNSLKVSRIKAAFEEYMALHGAHHVKGCKPCEDSFTRSEKQRDSDPIPGRSEVTADSFLSQDGGLSISSSSSGGEEGAVQETWKGSSGLDQVVLSPLGNSLSSGDTSDDSNTVAPERSKYSKPHRKHVRISDPGSEGSGSGSGTGILKLPRERGSSLPRMRYGSSSEETGEIHGSRLKHPQSRFGARGKLVSARVVNDRMSSSDEGTGSGGRLACRVRNQSDSSHDGSEDSGSIGEKSKLPQMRRPASRMQRPRQIQRPKTSQQQGRGAHGKTAIDSRGNPTSRLQKPVSHFKGDGRQVQDQGKTFQAVEQQGSLEWQQLQLQQQQEKLHRQHQAAQKQQQENQQKLHNQQQQLQKDQQEKVSANLQKHQEILVEQQHQQLKRQHQMQQQQQQKMWQQQQQKSQELAMPKYAPRTQGMITKRSSNNDLTSSQRRSPETVKNTQEMRHSSPDLLDNRPLSSQHTVTVHAQEKQNGTDVQKQNQKSRLPAPPSRLTSSRPAVSSAAKREATNPAQTKNISNGIPIHKSKMPSPKSPKRSIPTSNTSKLQKASPLPERRIPVMANASGSKQTGLQLQCNQNNSPSASPRGQVYTTLTTTTTTITTTTLPQSSSEAQGSKLPSPVKSNQKPISRLVQPKVKVQSKIPKGSGIPMKSRDAN